MSKRTLMQQEWSKKLVALIVLTLFWPIIWACVYALFFHPR